MTAAEEIEKLICIVSSVGVLDVMDVVGARNRLLDLFKLDQPAEMLVEPTKDDTIPTVLNRLVDLAGEIGLVDSSIFELRALFDTRIMGLLMPNPSTVAVNFWRLWEEQSSEAATDYFYQLSINANYIRMAEINLNQSWLSETRYGKMKITINLSKPEKDPRAIAMALNQKITHYPRCLLCIENVNYPGRMDFPARQTLRLVPVTLNGKNWYLQYSPYVYYNEHCIVLSEQHEPMVINRQTFQAILEFVSQFPHYFCGSNADLPIVGGSILNHNHFQGGCESFPIDSASVLNTFWHPAFPNISINYLLWPLTTLRLTSDSQESMVDLADHVLGCWRNYSAPAVEVLCESEQDGQVIPHNTITPIARQNGRGQYKLDLVLRNNRTTGQFPLGIFHPHPEIHNIKRENIGLIEVMGLAILPGRLKKELAEIKLVLLGLTAFDSIDQPDHCLWKHREWICEIKVKWTDQLKQLENAKADLTENGNIPDDLDKFLQSEVCIQFNKGLEHCGVFKHCPEGDSELNKFMEFAGFKKLR